MMFFSLIFIIQSLSISFAQSNLCLSTFDNPQTNSDPSLFPRTSIFVCPSSCFTQEYLINRNRYPIYGFQIYSGNSIICKSALHDSRLFPSNSNWNERNSSINIRIVSSRLFSFNSSLQNGILSTKYSSEQISLNAYQFINDRVNESRIEDVAIEHRGYLYQQDQTSTIICRNRNPIRRIDPIEIDHQWKIFVENSLKYFTYPILMNRSESINFCQMNNGTLMYWSSIDEENQLKSILYNTIESLFRYQIQRQPPILSFFIGFQSFNSTRQWFSNIIPNVSHVNVEPSNDLFNDFCTKLESFRSNPTVWRIVRYSCNDTTIRSYPLCRFTPSKEKKTNPFIYRIETADSSGNLTGVIDFCSELGGYPIYANNAYEWQIIQEIMLNDPDFTEDYVYTGLISQNKSEMNSFWMPRNNSYDSQLGFIRFYSNRGLDRIGYHLSRANNEPFYFLQDINPYSILNRLRFCRKDPIEQIIKENRNSCEKNSCRSQCLQYDLSRQSDDSRYSLFACLSEQSLYSTVYTHSFPKNGDFLPYSFRSSSSELIDLSVSIRDQSTNVYSFSFLQIDRDLRLGCQSHLNMDYNPTFSSSSLTRNINCDRSNSTFKQMNLTDLPSNYNSIVTLALENRRMSGFHFRFIDYSSDMNECNNRGVLHPIVNQCICAPAFYGDQCQFSCPRGYYGQQCDFRCSQSNSNENDEDICRSLLICLPDPYGCSCYSGWSGPFCNSSCPSDRYGPNCLFRCSCPSCNRFTGVCNCNGTECYQGSISRNEIENRCSIRSNNLVVLIVVPIVCVLVLLLILLGFFFWKRSERKKRNERNFIKTSSSRSNLSLSIDPTNPSTTIRSNPYSNEFFILSERL